MLQYLDIFYTIAHLALMAFNLTGWIWKKTRKAHIATLGLTLLSWVVLGIWYGWGYCPLTDWQWEVKEKLGETNLPNSFVKYYADHLTGRDIPASLVDAVTLGCLVFAIAASLYVNLILPGRKKSATVRKQY